MSESRKPNCVKKRGVSTRSVELERLISSTEVSGVHSRLFLTLAIVANEHQRQTRLHQVNVESGENDLLIGLQPSITWYHSGCDKFVFCSSRIPRSAVTFAFLQKYL